MKPQEALSEPSAPTREEEQAEVIRRLEEDIIFGRFAPGSRLVEDTLMTRYGASRHFVRQPLFQLERQGIVLREKNIGATVRFYSADEVRQIYEVREMLTRQAALMIALPAPRSRILDLLLPRSPVLRKVVWAVPEWLRPKDTPTVWVQAYDAAGLLVHDLQTTHPGLRMISGVRESGGTVWLGSLESAAIGRITL